MDEFNVELALINLLENAIKYSPEPQIIIETGTAGNGYFISIKDNGIGIEKKYISKIFRKFYRVPTGNIHDVKGFGLGLDFVKQVVYTHQWKITVHSTPGKGTEFKIIIPLI
jgi:two-component system phosphate regulon sensor histidine kinase PhoR